MFENSRNNLIFHPADITYIVLVSIPPKNVFSIYKGCLKLFFSRLFLNISAKIGISDLTIVKLPSVE